MLASDQAIRTAIVDDADEIRELLKLNLDNDDRFEFVGEAGDGSGAVALALRMKPHAVIVDLDMPESDGLTAIRGISSQLPSTKIIVFSARYEKYDAEELLEHRAHLYVDKTKPVPELLEEIARIVREG